MTFHVPQPDRSDLRRGGRRRSSGTVYHPRVIHSTTHHERSWVRELRQFTFRVTVFETRRRPRRDYRQERRVGPKPKCLPPHPSSRGRDFDRHPDSWRAGQHTGTRPKIGELRNHRGEVLHLTLGQISTPTTLLICSYTISGILSGLVSSTTVETPITMVYDRGRRAGVG